MTGASRMVGAEITAIDTQSAWLVTRSGQAFRTSASAADTIAAVERVTGPDGPSSAAEESLLALLVREGSATPPPADVPAGTGVVCCDPALAALRPDTGDGLLGTARWCWDTKTDLDPAAVAGAGFLLLISAGLDWSRWHAAQAACAPGRVPWLSFHLEASRGWISPVLGTGQGLTVDDIRQRWITAADDVRLARLNGEVIPVGCGLEPGPRQLAWLSVTLAAHLAEVFGAGPQTRHRYYETELDPVTAGAARHLIVPLPFDGRPEDGSPRPDSSDLTGLEAADLIDPRSGVITGIERIRHDPAIPAQLVTVHTHVANMQRISPWKNDLTCAGTSFGAADQARNAAIGEALERYSGELIAMDRLVHRSYDELTAVGDHAVDPDRLVLFAPSQYDAPGFPFVPFTRDLRVHWIRGRSLSRGCDAWLPGSLVYPGWYVGSLEADPHTNNPFYPGLAAGPDLDSAIAAGIQEVIERHATMVWWANRQPLPAVRLSPRLQRLWAGEPERRGQRAWAIYLENEFGVPVIGGVVESPAEGFYTMGFAARPDAEDAIEKAWAEALTLQDGCRHLLDPDGGYWRSIARGDVNGRFFKPYRADRRYLDDYRDDFKDVAGLMCQLQIFVDPRAREIIRDWTDVPATVGLDRLPEVADFSAAAYQKLVEAQGYEIFYVDVTTSDVARTPVRVVRVLIPGLVPNYSAAFPFLGGGRLAQAAVDLGWRTEPLAEGELNMFPMPHA